ncbi:11519_t:CDS:2 [Rhizophagus irregularis]|nr:11519_t:CDS:2 [Rhizophagus irregularis]
MTKSKLQDTREGINTAKWNEKYKFIGKSEEKERKTDQGWLQKKNFSSRNLSKEPITSAPNAQELGEPSTHLS